MEFIPRPIYSQEHKLYRQWEEDGKVSREVWLKAGAAGFLCSNAPEEFGGAGYMMEYPIAHAFIDSPIRKIAGGSSEVMREVISRKLFA